MTVTAHLGGDWNVVHLAITFFTTGAGFGLLANLVNTAPVPKTVYARWLLSNAQWFIGQKDRSVNTSNNQDTITKAVAKPPEVGK